MLSAPLDDDDDIEPDGSRKSIRFQCYRYQFSQLRYLKKGNDRENNIWQKAEKFAQCIRQIIQEVSEDEVSRLNR